MKCLIFDGEYSPMRPNNIKVLIIEWWIHNIGYWLTKPFTFIPAIKKLNLRFKDVDLMVDVSIGEEKNEES